MVKKILVFLEQRDNLIKKSSFEVVNFASELAGKINAGIEAVVIGNETGNIIETGSYGVKKVTHLKNKDLENYSASAYADLLADFAAKNNYDTVLLSNTAMGKDLAPLIAVKLDAGIAVDCINVDINDGELILTRPVYAGKALANVKIKTDRKVITLRPNVFKAENDSTSNAEIETVNIDEVNLKSKVTEIKKLAEKLDVSEADIIVSGGRGLQNNENFDLVEELAEVLGAAHGASRAVVDAGWRPHSEQVGQTGKTVSPSLYIAIGISGAIQHLAGMSSSKYIVAINKDKDAPMFQVADYGIAGDALEVVPVLIEELKKIKSN